MNAAWFNDQNNSVCVESESFIQTFELQSGIENLKEKIELFKEHPVPEGRVIKGASDVLVKILIPEVTFKEKIKHGEKVWMFFGEDKKACCLYSKDDWETKQYAFFRHEKCECFPCHSVEDEQNFNCLFCYCPLYPLKDQCGGNPKFTTAGYKDCSECTVPHRRENYGYIMEKFRQVAETAKMPVKTE